MIYEATHCGFLKLSFLRHFSFFKLLKARNSYNSLLNATHEHDTANFKVNRLPCTSLTA